MSNETILRLDAENRAQTLAEELEFLKSVHEQVSPFVVVIAETRNGIDGGSGTDDEVDDTINNRHL